MATVQKICCQIERIIDHRQHVYTILLVSEKQIPLFKPGQFLHLALDPYDPSSFWPESRVFSIASSPVDRHHLKITYSVQGQFTARMERELKVDRIVWVKLPFGEFIIDNSRDAVLFAGGTGLSAFTAFIESLTIASSRTVCLFYGARNKELLIYLPLVQSVAMSVPNFHAYYFVENNTNHSSSDNPITGDEINKGKRDIDISMGRISVELAWGKIKDPVVATYYLSGPPAMLNTISADLKSRHITPDTIKIDAW